MKGRGTSVPVTIASTVVADPGLVVSKLSNESILLSLKNNTYYGLDIIGTRVWQLIQTPVCVAALRDQLMEEYVVDSEKCEREVLQLLEELNREGLIEVRG